MATGDRIGIADKTTLDSVNEKIGNSTSLESTEPTTLFSGIKSLITSTRNTDLKVGTSGDAASTTPTTIFSGIKSLISRVTGLDTKLGTSTDAASTTPTTIFSGIKGIVSKLDTVLSSQKSGVSLSKYYNSALSTPYTNNGTYTNVFRVNSPGRLYYMLTVSASNATYIKIIVDSNVIFWGAVDNNNAVGVYVNDSLPRLYNPNSGAISLSLPSSVKTISSTTVFPSSNMVGSSATLVLQEPIRFNSLEVETLFNGAGVSFNYSYVLD